MIRKSRVGTRMLLENLFAGIAHLPRHPFNLLALAGVGNQPVDDIDGATGVKERGCIAASRRLAG